MSTPPSPTLGPCSPWITGADVAEACNITPDGGTDVFDVAAEEASSALFQVSGRQFTGLCERVVRPTRDLCQCWGPSSLGIGPWAWTSWGGGGWGWANEAGDRLGCYPMSVVKLAGMPVREITEVLIDGVVLPPLDTNGNPNYRIDKWRTLVRMDDPGPPSLVRRLWPGCQNLSLDPTQIGTFQVTYQYGVDPPQLGKDAAAQIACQLYRAFNGQENQLPPGTTKVTRQGVTVERGLLVNWFDPTKPTGLVHLDLFLKAYWRTRAARRSAVFSPDVQGFARPAGF